MEDGSGNVAGQNSARVYVPSLIAKDGVMFAVRDTGLADCRKSGTGEESCGRHVRAAIATRCP